MPFVDATEHTLAQGPRPPPPTTGLWGLMQQLFGSAVSGEFLDPTGRMAEGSRDYLRMMGSRVLEDVADLAEHPENLIGPGPLGVARVPGAISAELLRDVIRLRRE